MAILPKYTGLEMKYMVEKDYRLQHALQPGDILVCGEDSYTIGEVLGLGGTSIIYSATEKTVRDGVRKLRFAIKEWFPYSDNYEKFIRKDGIVQPKDPEDPDCFACYRKKFQAELEKGEEIRNATNKAISFRDILHPTAIYHGGRWETETVCRGIFALMERQDQKGLTFKQLLDEIALPPSKENPLRTGNLPTVHTTACIMEAVLKTLKIMHEEANYLHLDISDQNIIFTDGDLSVGEIGDAHFLDFAYAKNLGTNKKTDPIEEKDLFSTHGFVPPEFRHKNDGRLRLGPEADLFSVGALMLRCLLPDERIEFLGKSPRIRELTIYPHDGKQLGINEKIRGDLNRILLNAMNHDREKRYQSVAPFLADIQEVINEMRQDYSLPTNLSHSSSFIPHSRDREVATYIDILKNERRCFIYGPGGQGKSETGIELGLQMPRRSYLINWHNSMCDTIADLNFKGCNYQSFNGIEPEKVKQYRYEKNLEILMRNEFRNVLLIFDDFYQNGKTLDELQSEPAYWDVYNKLPSMVTFTTRYDMQREECELKPLDEDVLVGFMQQWPGCKQIPVEKLKTIIQACSGNILFVELCAKSISCSWNEITVDTIIDCLASNELKTLRSPKIRNDKDSFKTGQFSQKRIYEHLKALFKISSLKKHEKNVMRYMVVNPKQEISAVLFRACLTEKEKEALMRLVASGWIKRTVNNTLSIHPLIKLLCKEELNPTDEQCSEFLSKLRKTCQHLFFISGSAGVGKSTVLSIAMKNRTDIRFVPGVTTRAIRPGETEGVHYFFKSYEAFQKMVKQDLLVEYDQHMDNWYGTPRIILEESLVNYVVFLDLTVDTIDKIKARYPECTTIFIAPPSEEVLEQRLRRNCDHEVQIQRRLERARFEARIGKMYDYMVRNHNPEQCAQEILEIVKERLST